MKDPHLFSIHSKAKPYFLKLSSMSPNTSPYSKINPFLKPLNEMPVAPHDEKSLHRAINPTCSTTSSCQLQLFLVVLGWRSLDKMKKQRKKRIIVESYYVQITISLNVFLTSSNSYYTLCGGYHYPPHSTESLSSRSQSSSVHPSIWQTVPKYLLLI